MALPKFEKDIAYISALDDLPNDVGGLTAAELKAAFDQAGIDIKNYINATLIPYLEGVMGAAAIGIAEDTDLNSATNVQEALQALKQAIVDSVAGSIPDGSLSGSKLKNGAIGTRELGNESVTGAKVELNTLDSSHIKKGGIKTESYGKESVDGNALGLESVNTKHVAPKAINEEKLDDSAVDNRVLATKAVTADKVADNARTLYFTKTIAGVGWTGTTTPFEQRVDIPGISAGSAPTVVLSASATEEAQLEAFNAITLKATEDGHIVYVSAEIPAVDIPVDVTHTIVAQTGTEWVSGDGVFTQEIALEGLMATLAPNASYESEAITKLIAKDGVLEVTASSALEESVSITITQTRATEIVVSAWYGTSAPFACTVEHEEISEFARPKIYFTPPEDFAALEDKQEAFSLLYDVEADEKIITLYAKEKPEVDFDIAVEVARI